MSAISISNMSTPNRNVSPLEKLQNRAGSRRPRILLVTPELGKSDLLSRTGVKQKEKPCSKIANYQTTMSNNSKKPSKERKLRPAQSQRRQPGMEDRMKPAPKFENPNPPVSGRLHGRVALVTGGDSGIGRAVAIAFAREGADVAVCYLNEESDAEKTAELIRWKGRSCLLLKFDVASRKRCEKAVASVIKLKWHATTSGWAN
jgi:hypothetical protein